jgi:3D-(3,5/4)-trihydroxycyclohexane-1,2-dione acylhydrolase (decyclizing)
MAAEADVILAIGTRLQDFTTGSWTVFDHKAKFISINAARWDATKHRALSVVGDAKATMDELAAAMTGYKAPAAWMAKGHAEFADWNKSLDGWQKPTNDPIPTYGQVVGVVNRKAGERDYMITAAGGLPGETMKNWRVKSPHTFDCEFGFSCMGYEIAGGWGAAMADPTRDVFVMVGDGSYMLMNSDIYNSVLFGHKMIVIVCDNGGYAVINRLQNFKGAASYNNLVKDSLAKNPFPVDFIAHAKSMGAYGRKVESLAELETAIDWAKANDKTTVISIVSDAFVWTPGDALWDVGVPQVSTRSEVNEAAKYQADVRSKQRVGV